MKIGRTGLQATVALLVGAAPLHAQSVRISGVTSFQYLDVRPLVEDSVPVTPALTTRVSAVGLATPPEAVTASK